MSAYEEKTWLKAYCETTQPPLDYDHTLLEAYDNTMESFPHRPAYSFMGRSTNYHELDRSVRRAAAGLRAFGVRPGDRVAVALPNCPQHVIIYWAILKLGAVVVEHNPLYTPHELEGPFNNHGARVAIVWDKRASLFDKLRASTPLETIVSVDITKSMPRPMQLLLRVPLPKIADLRDQMHGSAPNTVPWEALLGSAIGGEGEDVETPDWVTKDSSAVIMYTSGTTGKPKGAVLTHGNLYANCAQGKAWVPGLGDEPERLLAALPFFHAFGLTIALNISMFIGGQMLLIPAPKPDLIMSTIKKMRPTFFSGVPQLFEMVMNASEEKEIPLTCVKYAFCGGSTLPPSLVDKWIGMTQGQFAEGYGLTETAPIIVATPMNEHRKKGYIGVPFPDTEVLVVNKDNLDEPMPDGEPGEVLVKGPQVFHEYLDNPEATEAAFHNGWFLTGDMGVMDSDGFVKLVARLKEVIITGGFNVAPDEVEQALLEHPDIEACAVVGRPRPDGAEDVVACVVLRDGAIIDPENLKSFTRERLTRYKVPRTFYSFDDLPRNFLGKTQRTQVRADLVKLISQESTNPEIKK